MKNLIIMIGILFGVIHIWATDITQFYYIKNELDTKINVQIDCGKLKDIISIDQGTTARFFVKKCTTAPAFSVIEIGSSDSLDQVKNKPLSLTSYARIYRNKNIVSFQDMPLASNTEPGEGKNIETYDLAF